MPGKRYRSDVFRSTHSRVEDLYAIGAIDKATMRGFNLACLTEMLRCQEMQPKILGT